MLTIWRIGLRGLDEGNSRTALKTPRSSHAIWMLLQTSNRLREVPSGSNVTAPSTSSSARERQTPGLLRTHVYTGRRR